MKLIFIDIDNTLLDFDEYVRTTLEKGFNHYNLTEYKPYMYDVFTSINNELWLQIEKGQLSFPNLKKIRFNLIFEKLGIDFDGPTFEEYFRKELNESAIIIDGAMEMLETLSKDYILCAASNGPYHQQLHRLELANMSIYFTYVFISENVGYSKPDPAFFREAFKTINNGRNEAIIPADCMIIGDSMTSDIAGGRNYGMKTCLYRRNSSKIIDQSQVNYIVDSLFEVINIF